MKKIYLAILLCGILQSCGSNTLSNADPKQDSVYMGNKKFADSVRAYVQNASVDITPTTKEDTQFLYYYVDVMDSTDKGYFVCTSKHYQKGDLTSFDDDNNKKQVVRVLNNGEIIKN